LAAMTAALLSFVTDMVFTFHMRRPESKPLVP